MFNLREIMDTNLDNLIQLRLEKLYNKKKDISEEIANIKKNKFK